MTEIEKIKAITDAYNEYMLAMDRIKRDFDAEIEKIMEHIRERKMAELRQKIKAND